MCALKLGRECSDFDNEPLKAKCLLPISDYSLRIYLIVVHLALVQYFDNLLALALFQLLHLLRLTIRLPGGHFQLYCYIEQVWLLLSLSRYNLLLILYCN